MIIKAPAFLFLWLSLIINTHPGSRIRTSDLGLQGPVRSWAFQPDSWFNQECGMSGWGDDFILRFDREYLLNSHAMFGEMQNLIISSWPSGRVAEILYLGEAENQPAGTVRFFYNTQGQLRRKISEVSPIQFVHEYHYTPQGELDFIALYRYDRQIDPHQDLDEAQLLNIYYYQPDSLLYKIDSFQAGEKSAEDIFRYDSQSRLLSIQGQLSIQLEYGEGLFPSRISRFDTQGSVDIQYQLDSWGNITGITETFAEGHIYHTYIHISYWE